MNKTLKIYEELEKSYINYQFKNIINFTKNDTIWMRTVCGIKFISVLCEFIYTEIGVVKGKPLFTNSDMSIVKLGNAIEKDLCWCFLYGEDLKPYFFNNDGWPDHQPTDN